ncbi:hypothetical protein [Capnocytophaga leadbetteri]|uniref:hypothetical protein n=1 Tax=Capnocytophaga leadbetteri TaxID=327575 RepID=UPI0026ECCF55|nr:hypothetical protein [Capnocytophaga leadbetteri]
MELTKFSKDSLYQRISASYIDENFQLLPAEEAVKTRLRHIHGLRLSNKYSKHQAIQIHIREMGVSQTTAYRDYSWAMQIFGELDKSDINAERAILADSYWQLYQMALKDRDLEQARKALDSYSRLFNFDKEEKEINFEKITANEYHIRMSRKSAKMLRAALASGVVDFNSLPATDTEYEDITDEPDDETADETC